MIEGADSADRPASPPPTAMLGRLEEMRRRDRRRVIALAVTRALGAAILLLVGYYVLPVGDGSRAGVVLRIVVCGLAIVAVVGWELRAVNRAAFPELRAIEALAVTVTVIVVAFAEAYVNVSRHDPAAFNEALGRTSSLYFTITTLATVGYGDIHARTDGARILVMVQMIGNVAVVGASVKLIMGTARNRLTTEVQRGDG